MHFDTSCIRVKDFNITFSTWFLDLMGAFLGESSSSENCGSLLAVPGALAIMSTRCFLAALLLLLVPTSWKALSGS